MELEWQDIEDDVAEELEDNVDFSLQPSPKYESARIIKCVAHTIQLGGHDYLKKNESISSLLAALRLRQCEQLNSPAILAHGSAIPHK